MLWRLTGEFLVVMCRMGHFMFGVRQLGHWSAASHCQWYEACPASMRISKSVQLCNEYHPGALQLCCAFGICLHLQAPRLRVLQNTFALSGDGQLLVSAGPKLPFLLVYNLVR